MKIAPVAAVLAAICLPVAGPTAASEIPAKTLFSRAAKPAPLAARTIGYYTRGCVAGAVALAVDGPEWQAMRLSRNRYWGMPQLVNFIEKLARDSRALDGWPGLMVGDLSRPVGQVKFFPQKYQLSNGTTIKKSNTLIMTGDSSISTARFLFVSFARQLVVIAVTGE